MTLSQRVIPRKLEKWTGLHNELILLLLGKFQEKQVGI